MQDEKYESPVIVAISIEPDEKLMEERTDVGGIDVNLSMGPDIDVEEDVRGQPNKWS